MMHCQTRQTIRLVPHRAQLRRGFSLVELLVVIAIIALLISIALPSFRGARRQAKEVASQTTLTTIGQALDLFRGERALGGVLPPSASDKVNGTMIDPLDASGTPDEVPAPGATILCYALAGPDKQGTAGFRSDWANKSGGYNSGGIYDPNVTNPVPRYGPYAGAKLMEKMEPLRDIAKRFSCPPQATESESDYSEAAGRQFVFVDEFGSPILYYRARSAARAMVYNPNVNPPRVGVYDHRDNAYLTSFSDSPHRIAATGYDTPGQPGYEPSPNTFDDFILDRKASTFQNNDPTGDVLRAIPVRAEDYLLIAAGDDGFFGTKDDIKNWTD